MPELRPSHLRHNNQIANTQAWGMQFIERLSAYLRGIVLKAPMAIEEEPAARRLQSRTDLIGHNLRIDASLSGIGKTKSCHKEQVRSQHRRQSSLAGNPGRHSEC